ncbi:MAG: T9SS type A sorting domain-containing protein [Paludibacter sp.]
MKKTIISLSVMLLFGSQLFAQQLLSTAGGQQNKVSWSIGDLLTGGSTVSGVTVYQGFNAFELDVKTALSDVESTGINVFPNPVIDKLNINIEAGTVFSLSLTDLVGRTLISSTNQSGPVEVNLSQFDAGQYILKVYSAQFSKSTIIIKK